ncbi:hypothetical protein M9Y10_025172 [Tritrichomonas musculus]|uniref:Uncharacterized protein n=1 Tax=Tritrichomonas musculus TaxID=1915356 RepID=A0ABR2GKN5_9EUKA
MKNLNYCFYDINPKFPKHLKVLFSLKTEKNSERKKVSITKLKFSKHRKIEISLFHFTSLIFLFNWMSQQLKLPLKEDMEIISLPNEFNQGRDSNESDNSEINEISFSSLFDLFKYSKTICKNDIIQNLVSNCTNQLELLKRSHNIKNENINIFFRLLKVVL